MKQPSTRPDVDLRREARCTRSRNCGLQRRGRPPGKAAVTGARPGRGAAIGAQATIDVLFESPESLRRFIRQPAGLVQARQPLLKLSKHVA
jgi:hypothetical protein